MIPHPPSSKEEQIPTEQESELLSLSGPHYAGLLNKQDNLEMYRQELRSAQGKLEDYLKTLRLADIEIERRNNALKALTAFSYQASRLTEPAALMRLALAQVLGVTNAQAGAVVMIDPETKYLSLAAHSGLNLPLVRILTGNQFEGGASALMPFLVSGEGALLERRSTTGQSEAQLLETAQLQSLVSLPLQAVRHLFGALVLGRTDNTRFTPVDIHFLIGIAQETAVALESFHLRDKMWRMVENLMGQEEQNGSSPSLRTKSDDAEDAALPPLASQLAHVAARMGGMAGALFTLDNEAEEMHISLTADYGLSGAFTEAYESFALSEELFPFDQLLSRNLVVKHIANANHKRQIPLLTSFQEEGARSLIAIEFHKKEHRRWTLFITAADLNIFAGEDIKKLTTIAKEAFVPFLNDRPQPNAVPTLRSALAEPASSPLDPLAPENQEEDLEMLLEAMMAAEEEVQRHNADFIALNALSEALHSSLELNDLAKRVISHICDLLNTEAAWLYVTDHEWLHSPVLQLHLNASTGLPDDYVESMKQIEVGERLEGMVAEKNEALLINDTMQRMVLCQPLAENGKILAAAAIPLSYSDKENDSDAHVVGVLAVGMRYPYEWQPRQIRLLTMVANQLSYVIKNAQRYAQMQARVSTLSEMLKGYIRKG